MLGVDVSVAVNSTQWACLAAAGVSWASTRGWHSYGAFDGNAIGNLAGARAAGIASTDVYLFPCARKDAAEQVQDMLAGLQGSQFGRVWVDMEYNPSHDCGWSRDGTSCAFLREMVAVLQQSGVAVGVYSSHWGWNASVGLDCAVQGEYSLPLWYAHYDKRADTCSDFKPFAGWTQPFAKQFVDGPGTAAIARCGVSLDTSVGCGAPRLRPPGTPSAAPAHARPPSNGLLWAALAALVSVGLPVALACAALHLRRRWSLAAHSRKLRLVRGPASDAPGPAPPERAGAGY